MISRMNEFLTCTVTGYRFKDQLITAIISMW